MKRLLLALAMLPSSAFAQTVDLRSYWPQPTTEQLVAQDHTNEWNDNRKTVLRRFVKRGTVRGTPVIRLDEYNYAGWLDAWEYRDDGSQILEVATDTPSAHIVYVIGKEIQWGGVMSLNDVVTRSVQVDVAASTGVTAGYWNYGNQKITFSSFYSTFTTDAGLVFSNVVKLRVHQAWCANAGCSYPTGQNIWSMDYFLAPGVGIVQLDYILPNARRDYVVGLAETWPTP